MKKILQGFLSLVFLFLLSFVFAGTYPVDYEDFIGFDNTLVSSDGVTPEANTDTWSYVTGAHGVGQAVQVTTTFGGYRKYLMNFEAYNSDFTVCFDYLADGLNTSTYLFLRNGATSFGLNGASSNRFGSIYGYYTTSNATDNTWHTACVQMIRGTNTYITYKDGVEVASGANYASDTSATAWYIFDDNTGTIDNLVFYSRALSSSEIALIGTGGGIITDEDGACGTAFQEYFTGANGRESNLNNELCSGGTANNFEYLTGWGFWQWECNGIGFGSSLSCNAYLQSSLPPACGSDYNNEYILQSWQDDYYPSLDYDGTTGTSLDGLCAIGHPSSVDYYDGNLTNIGFDYDSFWRYTCTNGNETVTCETYQYLSGDNGPGLCGRLHNGGSFTTAQLATGTYEFTNSSYCDNGNLGTTSIVTGDVLSGQNSYIRTWTCEPLATSQQQISDSCYLFEVPSDGYLGYYDADGDILSGTRIGNIVNTVNNILGLEDAESAGDVMRFVFSERTRIGKQMQFARTYLQFSYVPDQTITVSLPDFGTDLNVGYAETTVNLFTQFSDRYTKTCNDNECTVVLNGSNTTLTFPNSDFRKFLNVFVPVVFGLLYVTAIITLLLYTAFFPFVWVFRRLRSILPVFLLEYTDGQHHVGHLPLMLLNATLIGGLLITLVSLFSAFFIPIFVRIKTLFATTLNFLLSILMYDGVSLLFVINFINGALLTIITGYVILILLRKIRLPF